MPQLRKLGAIRLPAGNADPGHAATNLGLRSVKLGPAFQHARVAKLADARDLKSRAGCFLTVLLPCVTNGAGSATDRINTGANAWPVLGPVHSVAFRGFFVALGSPHKSPHSRRPPPKGTPAYPAATGAPYTQAPPHGLSCAKTAGIGGARRSVDGEPRGNPARRPGGRNEARGSGPNAATGSAVLATARDPGSNCSTVRGSRRSRPSIGLPASIAMSLCLITCQS